MGRSPMLGVFAALCLAAAAFAPGGASASHAVPVKADKASLSFVTAYLDCLSPSVNDPSVGAGNNACPAAPLNPFLKFGKSGSAKLTAKRIAPNKPIKDLSGSDFIPPSTEANATGDIAVKYSQKALNLNFGAQDPANARINILQTTHVTDSGCTDAPDCYVQFPFPMIYQQDFDSPDQACVAGKCSGLYTLNTAAQSLDASFVIPFSNTATSNAVSAGRQANFLASAACAGPNDDSPPPGLPGNESDWYQFHVCGGVMVGKSSDADPASFIHPTKASKMQLAYVPAFTPLAAPRNHEDPYANFDVYDVDDAGAIQMGPKSSGSAKLTPASSAVGGGVKVSATFKDVRGGALPYNGPISLRFTVRVTHAACAGDITCSRPIEDVGVDGDCVNGTCKIATVADLDLPSGRASNVEIAANGDIGEVFGGATQLCAFDGPVSNPTAQPFACPGIYVP